jgi:hypothetical protein
MISRPKLASCLDRKKSPRSNSFCGDPEDWFRPEVLGSFNLRALTFDFFVDWSKSPLIVSSEFWLKALCESSIDIEINPRAIHEQLDKAYGKEFIETYTRFSQYYSVEPYAVIYHDSCDWNNKKSKILFVKFTLDINNQFKYETDIVSIQDFMFKIQENSGGPVRIGSKGLFYGTSRLECFLSKTTSLYPGDADLVLLDTEGKAKCVIEFKKHNLNSDITHQKISNYYPRPDGRKYDRLETLREFLSKAEKIPLIIIYYPTNTKEKFGVIEVITGSTGNLKTMASRKFELPSINKISEMITTVKIVLRGVEFYKKNNN